MDVYYEKSTLSNGLRLIKLPMPAVHSVAAGVYVKSGPRFETAEECGISHFVEHMLFKGTRVHPTAQAISEAIDNIGGDVNGSTMPEYSEFLLIVHPRHFEEGLRIFGDILLNSTFAPDEIENEKKVVAEEISQYRDIAGDSVNLDELAYNLMWPTKAMVYSALGSNESVHSFTREQLLEYYRKHYVPSNLVLVIAGNFDPARVDALVAEVFGGGTGSAEIHQPEYVASDGFPRAVFRKMPTSLGYIKLCHQACSYRDPNFMASLIICDVLGGGTASRLFATLREEEGLVYDISAGAVPYSDVGSIDIVTSTNRSKLIATLAAILEQIRILREEGVSEQELARVKDRVACQRDFLLDSPSDLVEWMGVRELLTSPEKLETPSEEVERLRAVAAERVNEVIREYLVPERCALVLVGSASWLQRRQIDRLLKE